MKIYTKTGDTGETGLFGGGRVSKASPRVHVYGQVDELNSSIGLARSFGVSVDLDAVLGTIQNELFQLGAELGTRPDKLDKLTTALLDETHVEGLERAIDNAERDLEPLKTFVLPGGHQAACALHLARCVCRRCERDLVGLQGDQAARPEVLRYINRLSDLLFVFARRANHDAGVSDVPWLG